MIYAMLAKGDGGWWQEDAFRSVAERNVEEAHLSVGTEIVWKQGKLNFLFFILLFLLLVLLLLLFLLIVLFL